MSSFALVRELWQQHQTEPFPRGRANERVDVPDLVLIDGLVAGCVSAYLGRRRLRPRPLDAERRAGLLRCRDELLDVVPQLDGRPRQYFERVLQLADAVLTDP